MLGTPGSYRFDDSGMAPDHVQTTASQPLTGTFGDNGMHVPFFGGVQTSRFPRLAAFWQRRLAGLNPMPGNPATPATPATPAAPAQPAAPYNHPSPSGASLGQLFSGYGY